MSRLDTVIAAIDAANAADPNTVTVDGQSLPKELVYSQRMTAWLEKFAPDAPETTRIAARAQHIERWTHPRSDYPMTRTGYYEWRTNLGIFHGERTAELMQAADYTNEEIETVKRLLRKERIKQNADVQELEDIICLVFIEHYLEDFSKDYTEEKLIDIIRKTWRKMSDKGHQAATTIPLPNHISTVLTKALTD